jgi:hypothetical protein
MKLIYALYTYSPLSSMHLFHLPGKAWMGAVNFRVNTAFYPYKLIVIYYIFYPKKYRVKVFSEKKFFAF